MTGAAVARPPACRICSAPTARVHRCAERRYGTAEVFDYAECPCCGTLQLVDVPADLSPYYPPRYYAYAAAPGIDGRWKRAARSVRAHAVLRAPPAIASPLGARLRPRWDTWLRGRVTSPRATIVDIGCGRGHLLAALRNNGFPNVVGYDPYLPKAPGRRPAPLHRVFPESLAGRAQLVMLHHSLEHARDPADALAEAARLLAPGGAVIVRVPLADSYAWRHYGTDWYALDPPRHLFLLTERALDLVARSAGLAVTRHWRDSTAEQFAVSEQFRRGIVGEDPRSIWRGGTGIFTDAQLLAFAERAGELNERGEGDTGCFVLERRDPAPPVTDRSVARRPEAVR